MENLGTIISVADFVNKVQNLYKSQNTQKHLFFRGLSKDSYQLLPSVFRPPFTQHSHSEKDIILDVKQYAPEHNISYSIKELDKVLCDMQHNEIPTRLLDWTISPLTALYFASESHHDASGKIWIFDPWGYNTQIIKYKEKKHPQIHDIHVIARALIGLEWSEKEIAHYLHNTFAFDQPISLDDPVAFVAPFTNKRKVFQRGAFLIFGTAHEPFETCSFAQPFLSYYTLPKENKEKIIQELNNLYINGYTVYPDYKGMKTVFEKNGSLFNRTPYNNWD